MTAAETRTVSSTGGAKGVKEQRHSLIPRPGLDVIAEVFHFGAAKYADHNWRKGYEWSKSYDALIRHLTAWWDGEDVDPESGLSHLGHAGFHVLALATWERLGGRYTQFDDRYRELVEPPVPSGLAPDATAIERVRYWTDRFERAFEIREEDPHKGDEIDYARDELEAASCDLVDHGPDYVRSPTVPVGQINQDAPKFEPFKFLDIGALQARITDEVVNLAKITQAPGLYGDELVVAKWSEPATVTFDLVDASFEALQVAFGIPVARFVASAQGVEDLDPDEVGRQMQDAFNRRG